MAKIVPIRALRYTAAAGELCALCCPPYDIISPALREELLARSDRNVIRLELPSGEQPYEQAAATLREWRESGVLAQDAPSVYIYELAFEQGGFHGVVRGLVCGVKLEEFEKGIILPHENTLSKAKEDRLLLMEATACNFSQVYCLYSDSDGAVQALFNFAAARQPDCELRDGDGVIHKLWRCGDAAIAGELARVFEDKKLYIADGHHRYETALNYRNRRRENGTAREGDACDYQMMMLVALECPGLLVLPTHRLVSRVELEHGEFIAKLTEHFEVREQGDLSSAQAELKRLGDAGETAFAMLCRGGLYCLRLKDASAMASYMPEASPALRSLDVSVLHALILERLLGIDKCDMAQQRSLVYTRSAEEAADAVSSGRSDCAFLLNATRVSQISAVALAGDKMPQKSTYFYPKLITGLVINPLD